MAAGKLVAIPSLLLAILVAWLPAAATAQGLPLLGEHEFVPATSVEEPFITTFVQSTVSVGQIMNMTVPVFDVSDSTLIGTTQANLFVAGLGFAYQHRAKDWLAVNIGLFTIGRIGTSTPTLLSEGITGALGYRMGWLARIHQSEKILLSGSVDLANRQATYINLMDWVQGIIDGITGPENPLVRSASSLRGGGGLHFGWGLSRRFGLLSTWKLAYGEALNGRGSNQWSNDARLAVSYNALTDLKVPLGLVLTGGYIEDDERGRENTANAWFWSLRLGFQGRKDFSMGLDIKTSYMDRPEAAAQQVSQLAIDLRYYF